MSRIFWHLQGMQEKGGTEFPQTLRIVVLDPVWWDVFNWIMLVGYDA